jgi:putative spermidine/putrescine transport system permease protein
MSFNVRPAAGDVIKTFSPLNYEKIFTDIYYLKVILNTILIGAAVTFLTILLGFPLAFKYQHSRGRIKEIFLVIILGPLLITMVVRVYGWMIILGSNGLINNVLLSIGMINNPLKLMYNSTGVIIGLTHVLLPFMTISIATSLENIDSSINEAAEILGASKRYAFLRITLPLCKHGIIAGSILVFSLAVSVFVTPMMLGGSGLRSIVLLIYTHGLVLINWPMAAALASILLAILILIMYLQNRIQSSLA